MEIPPWAEDDTRFKSQVKLPHHDCNVCARSHEPGAEREFNNENKQINKTGEPYRTQTEPILPEDWGYLRAKQRVRNQGNDEVQVCITMGSRCV